MVNEEQALNEVVRFILNRKWFAGTKHTESDASRLFPQSHWNNANAHNPTRQSRENAIDQQGLDRP